eukprot:7391045-Prymnesium_polylepis.1
MVQHSMVLAARRGSAIVEAVGAEIAGAVGPRHPAAGMDRGKPRACARGLPRSPAGHGWVVHAAGCGSGAGGARARARARERGRHLATSRKRTMDGARARQCRRPRWVAEGEPW